MSSSAFFIEAAAKTVMVLSCAAAGCGAREQRRARRATAKSASEHGGSPRRAECAPRLASGRCRNRPCRNRRSGIDGARTARRGSTGNPSKSGADAQGKVRAAGEDRPWPTATRHRRRVRLHHRRRGLGRLRAGQPAVGRSEQSRAAAGGRRPRQLDLVSHSGRLSVRDRQSALGLDVQDRAGAGPQRPRAELSARQGDRRLVRRSTP